jgi:glucoamylase
MSETTVTDVKTGRRSGKGTAPLSVSVINLDPSLGCDSATFQQCSDRALSSWKVVRDAFRVIFPVSARLPLDQPNPFLGWFLKAELFGAPVRRQLLPRFGGNIDWILFLGELLCNVSCI